MFRFRKAEHLRSPLAFQRVYGRRRSVSDSLLIVYGCENGLDHLRLGLSVSRKVGGAVERNRLRRLYREAFRLSRQEMPTGMDIVLVPRSTAEPTLEEVKTSLMKLVRALAQRLAKEAKQP